MAALMGRRPQPRRDPAATTLPRSCRRRDPAPLLWPTAPVSVTRRCPASLYWQPPPPKSERVPSFLRYCHNAVLSGSSCEGVFVLYWQTLLFLYDLDYLPSHFLATCGMFSRSRCESAGFWRLRAGISESRNGRAIVSCALFKFCPTAGVALLRLWSVSFLLGPL